jgi:SecD/SecF fusion protein
MQLKGLIRFFTVLLIVYSLYQLSFTWFVRNHEKKMETRARAWVKKAFPSAMQKYPGNADSQLIYQEILEKEYQKRLNILLDSTKDEIVTYGINGAMSYQKAKAEELNLGLDLQGGMNVTLEVEMTGLLKSLANDSKDPNFLKAIQNADDRKANSGADFITLFIEEYRKLEPNRQLATLFSPRSGGKIGLRDNNEKVISYIRTEATEAFNRTSKKLTNRIDQFGVAQPAINPNPEKSLINVELPGVKDKQRVRNLLQSTANLQFWETYRLQDLQQALRGLEKDFDAFIRGTLKDSSAIAINDTSKTNPDTSKANTDTSKNVLSKELGGDTTTNKQVTTTAKRGLVDYLKQSNGLGIGMVDVRDTAAFRGFLMNNLLRRYFPSDAVFAYGDPSKQFPKQVPLYVLRTYNRDKAPLEGDAIQKAEPEFDNGKAYVAIEMTTQGTTEWAKITKKSYEQQIPIAIVLDGVVYSAPVAEGELGSRSQITGNFTIETATDLANILKIGKLDAPAKIVQEQQVGATLGKKAIRGGAMAFIISFVVIFLLMLVYYNTSGWVANIALILNLLFTVGILAGLGATLTAPGIAGLVLTIGMAVDTNVIIYERIKEELTKGKGYIPAINEGYKRSLPPVLDAHVTTLLTAIILFYFGLGPVKGFATTQIIGILLSLFCGILVSRWITEWFTSKKKHLEYFTGVSKRVFQHAKFKFIEYRKVAYVISMIVLGLGIAAYFNGFDQGVEFKGGRSYNVRFDKPVDVELVRADLRVAFGGESPVIKTIGDNATLDITTSYQINNTSLTADSLVEATLISGLKKYLPPDITYQKFDTEYKQGSNKVLPTISDDLKSGAVKATVFALLVIFLYIFIRFRDWRYSLGTIVALLHDVLVTLAVFSFAREIVPFPLEIDQHFIAAVLTVIGFSMNDTVIVFDRIREDTRLMPGAPRTEVINRAINETLSRTIMTSLTVFLTILILFIVGGEVTKGFAFAMLIGVITGTYSSIFVAAPILVDLGGKRGLGRKAVKETVQKPAAVTPRPTTTTG